MQLVLYLWCWESKPGRSTGQESTTTAAPQPFLIIQLPCPSTLTQLLPFTLSKAHQHRPVGGLIEFGLPELYFLYKQLSHPVPFLEMNARSVTAKELG